MLESNLRIYSLGIVTKDKTPLDDFIEVCPIEKFSIQESGLIDEKEKVSKSNLKDTNNKGFSTEVKSKTVVKAKWFPLGVSNRTTAPDVYKNETVILFKFADVNEYYWTVLFREPNIRRLETVLHSYSNKRSGLDAFDSNSSYWFLIDTRNKSIKLHTSNNDGEYTTYDFILDTKNGSLTIKDGKNNSVVLNSPSDTITVNTNNNVTINAASSVVVNSPNITLNGNVTITQNLSVLGNSSSSGNLSVNGLVESKSKIKSPLTETFVEGCCSCC